MSGNDTPSPAQLVLGVVIDEMPTIIAWLKAAFASRHPEQPQPTSAQIIAAYNLQFETSIAKDEAWKAAHLPLTP